jgi:maltose O-acetyltransferase
MKRIWITVAVVIAVLIAVVAWLLYNLQQQKQVNDEMQELAELDKQEMENEYERFTLQYSEMVTSINNDSIVAQLTREQMRTQQLLEELNETKEVIQRYNQLSPRDFNGRLEMLEGLLGHVGDDNILINQPFYCDYGKHISVGKRFFANFNFTVLDEALVTIGDDCFIGPNVSIYTACHSTDPRERNARREWAQAVTIGDNVWIGGSVTILAGVTIGDNVTIGAGSVVTRDIPSNTVAVGNPCRPIKAI